MRKMQICGGFIVIAFILTLSALAADRSGSTSLSSLPAAAQARISAAIGRDNPGYSATAVASGFEATNAGQNLITRFKSEGVEVRHGNAVWGLVLCGYGYGNALTTTKAVAPQSRTNRVEYRRGGLTEWYVNGPAGLEQGFTLKQPPDEANGEPLTIALAVLGNLRMKMDERGTSVSLSERWGNAELRYTGLTATDAKGKKLRAWLQVQGEHLLLKVDDSGARYPVVIDPWVQSAVLTASDGTDYGHLAWSVSIDGNTIVVGAPWATLGSDQYRGAAYIFVKPKSGWGNMSETAKLTAADGVTGDLLGSAVAVSRNTVVVGVPQSDSSQVGAAYIYVKPASGWKTTSAPNAKLTASNGKPGDRFGWSVSISGNTVVAGAVNAPYGGNGSGPGAAYVFVKPTSGWADTTETAQLTSSDGASGDGLGTSVSISGNTVIAGAPQVGVSNYGNGAAYVFVMPNNGWANMTQTAKLIDGVKAGAFGWAVAISGKTAVGGAYRNGAGVGAAYVFVEPKNGWPKKIKPTTEMTASDSNGYDNFGLAVSLSKSGGTVVIGASMASDKGAAYVFNKPKNGWPRKMKETQKLTGANESYSAYFGCSVAISSNALVAGAPLDGPFNHSPGYAYVFGNLH